MGKASFEKKSNKNSSVNERDEQGQVHNNKQNTSIMCCQSLSITFYFYPNIFKNTRPQRKRAVVAGWTESKGETEGSLHNVNFKMNDFQKMTF